MRYLLLLFLTIMACRPSNKIGELVGVSNERSIENTYWVLTEINGTPLIINDARKPFIELNAETKSISGFCGCNLLSGGYQITGNKINFTSAVTRMFCQETMEIETNFLQALAVANTFEIKEQDLLLKNENKVVLKFHAESAVEK
ncbi:MAG: META domain-containing protein [Cyclobacteriaceae bacterium]|jgi:heat shock protein HslJ|nr:META domain-containing protein [Cyclobacteriaceae bacterium]